MSDSHLSDNQPLWSGRDVAFALFFLYIFWPQLSLAVLSSTCLGRQLCGPGVDLLLEANEKDRQESTDSREDDRIRIGMIAGPGAARVEVIDKEARRQIRARLNLWANVLAFPLQAGTVPVVFYALAGIPAARIGFTRQRFRWNVLTAVCVWLLVTPLVFGVNVLVEESLRSIDPDAVQEHALTRLIQQGPSTLQWTLIVFNAVIIAPVLEETVFRGVLQPWFANIRNGGIGAMSAALVLAILLRLELIDHAWKQNGEGLLRALMPALFVLAMMPLLAVVSLRSPGTPPAIFATSVLFAAMHSSVWPTPVALLVLGLALGTLAARTKSLVGPIVVHALFNAVTCVGLLLSSAAK